MTVSPHELDAVTLDAYGTLVELDRPVERLQEALRRAGVERSAADVARALAVEVEYYGAHKDSGRDEIGLARLHGECARVFVGELGAQLDFAHELVEALALRTLPGVEDALAAIRARGLAVAVVSNWDCSLPRRLEGLGLRIAPVITSATTGAAKPDPRMFTTAVEKLGVAASRTLHVGDRPEDEQGAAAAGLSFAPAPLSDVTAAWK